MVDQAWQPRLTEGMVRCYLVQDRVGGLRAAGGERAASAGAGAGRGRLRRPAHGSTTRPNLPHLHGPEARLETEWMPQLQRALGIATDQLPLLWDCDFLLGEPARDGERSATCFARSTSAASRRFRIRRSSRSSSPPSRRSGRRAPLPDFMETDMTIPARTHLLPSLDAERPFAEAHREPLREQLRRRAAPPERHHRAARVARFRERRRAMSSTA